MPKFKALAAQSYELPRNVEQAGRDIDAFKVLLDELSSKFNLMLGRTQLHPLFRELSLRSPQVDSCLLSCPRQEALVELKHGNPRFKQTLKNWIPASASCPAPEKRP